MNNKGIYNVIIKQNKALIKRLDSLIPTIFD
jgi:hypothetical protein